MGRFPLSHDKITVQYDGQREHSIGQHGCVNKLILICCLGSTTSELPEVLQA